MLFVKRKSNTVDCVARVKGGGGLWKIPCIEVVGNAGLAPFLDNLIPFRAIPPTRLSYAGERLYVPVISSFLMGKYLLSIVIYFATILLFVFYCFYLVLRIFGRRIVVVDSHSNRLQC
jgi:hypothetical protein